MSDKKSRGKSDQKGKKEKPVPPQSEGGKRRKREVKKGVSKNAETGSSPEFGIIKDSPPSKSRPGQFVKGDARINRTKPGPGRPNKSFRAKCRRMIARKETWRSVKRITKNEKHPLFGTMWKELAAHGHGKPPQVILTPSTPQPENTARFIHKMLEQMDDNTTGEK